MTTTASTQRQFDLRLPTGRPLVPVSACMVVLDRNEDDVLMLIDEGHLTVAFDIASRRAARREIRVWRESILLYAANDYAAMARATDALAADLAPALDAILAPRAMEHIRARELADRFTCSSTHVLQLVEEGSITGPAPKGRGPNSSPRIVRNSVAAFLQSRRIT